MIISFRISLVLSSTIIHLFWVMQPVLMKSVISFLVAECDCRGPPHGIRVLHEALRERAAPEERLSRRLGLDCATSVWLCDSRVSPRDGTVSAEALVWLPGKLRSCRAGKPCPSVLMILLRNFDSRYRHKILLLKCNFWNISLQYTVLKTERNGRGDPLRWPCDTLYPQKLALISPTSGGLSVGIVRLRTKKSRSYRYNTPPF
jgi:hypothetical protein